MKSKAVKFTVLGLVLSLQIYANATKAATVTWVGGSGDWNTATNWSTGALPGTNDDVVISPATTITVTHSSGTHIVKSIQSTKAFMLSGGLLGVTTTFQASNALTLSGGTLQSVTVVTTSGASVIISSGTLDGVTLNGTLDVGNTYNAAVVTVVNGLTLTNSATVLVGNPTNQNWGQISFAGSQTLGGSGMVIFGNQTVGSGIGCDALTLANGGTTLTIGPQVTVEGQYGTIGYSANCLGTPSSVSVINQGTISATGGGTITVKGQSFVNQGVIGASNGGQLSVQDFVGNVGQVSLIAGSTLTLNGAYTNNLALGLTNATLNLSGTWANTGSINATNSTLNLGGGSTQVGQITMPGSTLNVVGNFVAAQLAAIQYSAGAVRISGGVVDNTGNTLVLNAATGSWLMNGGTLRNGVVSCSGGAQVTCDSAGGTLDGVTLNGTLDVGNTYNGAVVTVVNGLVLSNAMVLVGNPTNQNQWWGQVTFAGSQSLGGNGTVVFGNQGSGCDALTLANGGTTLTIGPQVTVTGQYGTIGWSQNCLGTPSSVSVINQGTISPNVGGGTITVKGQSFVNQGVIEAENGGALQLPQNSTSSGNILASGNGFINMPGPVSLNGVAILSTQPGSTLQVGGALLGSTKNLGQFTAQGTLVLNGSGTSASPQLFEIMGQDYGTSQLGFIHNFNYGTIVLANNTYVQLTDQYKNSGSTGTEALYVNSIVVPSGTTLDLHGYHVYARGSQVSGTVRNGTITQIPNSGPIGFGQPTLGYISTPGQLDQWTFFARAGEFYTIVLDPSSGSGVSPYLGYVQATVASTNGGVIVSNTNSSNGAVLTLANVAISSNGVYSVQVHASPVSPGSTGHYLVTVWETTPNVNPLTMNQIVSGTMQTPYSVDQWTFGGTTNQQVQFHLVNVAGPGVAFDLLGPNGWYGFTNITSDSALVTLPVAGNYSVLAHTINGQYGAIYAFELLLTAQTNVSLGSVYQGQFAATGQGQLLQFNVPSGSPLQIVLSNLIAYNHADIYVARGRLPTRSDYDFIANASGPNQDLLIPLATAGTWYVLIYGDNIQSPGGYTVTASSASVALTSITPNRTGLNSPTTLTIIGAGFDGSSSVQFIDGSSNVFPATSISVDSFTQITANEAAGILPAGTYSIRVKLGQGASATLANAFQVLSNGAPNLVTSLTLPSQIGYHVPATIYGNYANTGDASMPAPLLVLTPTQNGIQGAFLTLDSSLVAQGLWTSANPNGFSHSVQFLGSGQAPGSLLPGESFNTPIYYAGWQQPWNFSYPPVNWNLAVLQANDTTPIDWSFLETNMQPSTIATDAWQAIGVAFTNEAGSTWGGYVTMLDNNASYLGRLGLTVSDVGKLLAFQLLQADGLCPMRTLASSVDASLPTPGLSLTFSRTFGEPISQRYALGAFGRGWFHNWQYSLQQGSDGTITISGPNLSRQVFQPDTRGGYFNQAGNVGKLASAGGGAYTLTEKSGLIYYYRSDGKLGYVQDLNGNTITLGYSGNLLTSLTHSSGQYIQIAYNGAGLVQKVTDSLNHQTILSYDGAYQHLTGAQYFDGRTSTYTYNTTGNAAQIHELTAVASSCCNWRYFTYDSFGRLTETYLGGNNEKVTLSYPNSGEVVVTDALTNSTQFFFEHRGLLAKTEDALGNAVHRTFDASYNLVAVTDPAGRSSNYSYDNQANLVRSVDPQGGTIQFAYTTAFNRLAALTDANSHTTRYAYDPNGNLQTTTYPDSSVENWTYDFMGNPQTWNNRRGRQTFYTFNDNGQLSGKYFADGSATEYSYDILGRLTNSTTFDTQLNPLETVDMIYDLSNRLSRITYPGGKYLAFTYDDNGRRLSSVDQLGHALSYTYDMAGRLVSMTNELNTMVALFEYDPMGRLAKKTVGNGMFTTYQYDPAGQTLNLTNSLANGTVLSWFNYTYDSRGRRYTMQSLDGTWTYGYDDLGQLTHAVLASAITNIPNQDLTYNYDAMGNRTVTIENGVTNSYSVNNLNQYAFVGQTNYTFDADGNPIKEVSPVGTTTYTYNDESRLVAIASSSETWSYGYNGLGSRTVSTENGVTSRTVIDPTGFGDVVGEYDLTGSLLTHFEHALNGIGLLTQSQAEGSLSLYNFDASGNVVQLIDTNGLIQDNFAFAPFGNEYKILETISSPFAFSGQSGVISESKGRKFARARYFEDGIGRFLNEDPIGWKGGDYNFYRYVNNSPISFLDPSGLITCGVSGTVSPIGIGVTGGVSLGGGGLCFTVGAGPATPQASASRTCSTGNDKTGGGIQISGSGPSVAGSVSCNGSGCNSAIGQSFGTPGVGIFGTVTVCVPPPCFSCGNPPPCIGCGGGSSGGSSTVTTTTDPNNLTGPGGYGISGFVTSGGTFAYRIDFENVTNASAPVQQAIINNQLGTNFDWTTFNVTEIGFGDHLIPLPPGTSYYAANVPVSYLGTNFQVQIQVGIQPGSGLVYANFHSIDPNTSLPPPVNIGFLPPEDGTGRGEGHVSYTIRAKSGLATGTQLRNVALISFDNQPSIATDQVNDFNPAAGTDPNKEALITLDSIPPTSHVNSLPAQSQLLQVPVSWTGQDDAGGSGVASFDIYVSDNGGGWSQWLSATTSTNATFQGKPQHTYGFKSVARDNAGNVEAQHASADASTLIVANPQFQLTVTPPSTNLNVNDSFSYAVTVKNIGSLTLTAVNLTNTMPQGIGLNYVQYGRGSLDIGNGSFVWSLGNMATNTTATLTVNASAVANGTWSNLLAVADSQGAASASASELIQIGPVGPPALSITLIGSNVVVSWPQTTTNFFLESSMKLSPANWGLVTNTPVVTNGMNTVSLPVVAPSKFFRLSTVAPGSGPSAPMLTFSVSGNQIVTYWPLSASGYNLQSTTNIAAAASWSHVTNAVTTNGQCSVSLPMNGPIKFFRLSNP